MTLLAPAGLAALLLVPIVVALHFWHVRYRRLTVPSTLLWARVAAEVVRRRPRRLPRDYLLLALHVAVLCGGALALAQPGWLGPRAARQIVAAVDTSLGMSATDVRPSRLAAATAAVRGLIDGLGPADALTLVDAGSAPRILAASGERTALDRGLAALVQGSGTPAWAVDAALLQGLAAARGPRTAVYLYVPLGSAPAALATMRAAVPGLRVVPIGTATADLGVAGLTATCSGDGGRGCTANVRLINTASRRATTPLTALVDGQVAVEEVTLPPASTTWLGLALPAGARSVVVRLAGHDALPADDQAQALVPAPGARTIALITGDPASPLARVLRALPGLTVRTVAPGPAAARLAAGADLVVVDGGSTAPGPPGPPNLLVVNPPPGSAAGLGAAVVAPHLTAQDPQSALLGGVDLRSLVLYSGVRASLPAWAHADLQGSAGPLLYNGSTGGRRVAVLLMDPTTHGTAGGVRTGSNLATLEAFPILVRNAVEALAPLPPAATAAGQVLAVPLVRRGPVWLQPDGGPARMLARGGSIAAVPPLSPGLYSLRGAISGLLAVNVTVPQDPLASPALAPPPVPAPPPAITPVPAAPGTLWPLLVLLLLLLLGGEWWYDARRT